MVKMTLSESQFLTKNFDFRGHISTFRAENTPKSWHFKVENNALTTSEHLQNNFQKSQITPFFDPKHGQNPGAILLQIWPISTQIVDLRGLDFFFVLADHQNNTMVDNNHQKFMITQKRPINLTVITIIIAKLPTKGSY